MVFSRMKTQQQDASGTNARKRLPLLLIMVILLCVIVSVFYILAICLRQANVFGHENQNPFVNHRKQQQQLCPHTRIPDVDLPHLHFPNPETFDRQECACNPVLPFAIVSMQRSGSGWFETLLNSHINLTSNGEIFGARHRRNNASVIYKILDQVYNLDWFSSASKNECTAAVGFKWMLNQGLMEYHEEIADYFNRNGVSIIFLFRRNLLRRMVSLLANSFDKDAKLLNGTHKSHVHSPREAEILARYKPNLNVTVLVSNLKSAERRVAKALECFKTTRHIVLYYEDILSNRTNLVGVQEFLKLPTRNVTSLQVKIHSGPLSAQINNFNDVKKTLRGTSFEKFIKADY